MVNTNNLDLVKPSIDDQVVNTIPSLAHNFQKIDDKMGEVSISLADILRRLSDLEIGVVIPPTDTTSPVVTVLPNGGTYTGSQSIILSANEPATIYYTLDGSTPTTVSMQYSVQININKTTTLKYFARDIAGNISAVQTAVYIVNTQIEDTTAPIVTASPIAGTYASNQSVTLTANEQATIYYTLDGSTPTTSSSVYSSPISIPSTKTLRFFGKDLAGNSCPVQTATYTINLPDATPPVISILPPVGTYSSIQNITLTVDEQATIYYTLDGSTPTTSSSVYSSPIPISSNTTLKYFARDTAGNSSVVQTAVYAIEIFQMDYLLKNGVLSDPLLVGEGALYNRIVFDMAMDLKFVDSYIGDNYVLANNHINGNLLQIVGKTLRGVGSATFKSLFVDNVEYFFDANMSHLHDIRAIYETVSPVDKDFPTRQMELLRHLRAKVYSIKFYKDTTLVAHYDMSTGTVFDQTGNGYHGVLTGATWVDVDGGVHSSDTTPPVLTISPTITFVTSTQVVMSLNESGEIFYTTNGTTPTTASAKYVSPLNITDTTTIKAFGRDFAGNSSAVTTVIYTKQASDTTPPVLTITPSGTFTDSKTITMSLNESGDIYYTTDGSTPTVSSTKYVSSFNVTGTTTVKAFAKDTAGNSSEVTTVTYTKQSSDTTPPVLTITPSGMFTDTQTVTMSINESGEIFYTTDGSTPTISSAKYTTPLTITATTTVKAFGRDTAGNTSTVTTVTYTKTIPEPQNYLFLDGESGTMIETPVINTFNILELDINPDLGFGGNNNLIINGSGSSVQIIGYELRVNTLVVSKVLVNDTQYAFGSMMNFMQNRRSTIRLHSSGEDYPLTKLTVMSRTKAKVYNIRLYKDSVLVAHYDMTTGTIIDKTGNGNVIALKGGCTWV